MKKTRLILLSLVITILFILPNVFANNFDKMQVVLPGTIQGVLGGGNWNPADNITQMEHLGDGVFQFITFLPKGSYEYKVAINGSWEENYGLRGERNGPNIPLVIPEDNYQVRFLFDYKDKSIKDSVTGGIKPFRIPKKVSIIGLDRDEVLMQEVEGSFFKLTCILPAGSYAYRVQYDDSENFIFGKKGEVKGESIKLSVEEETEVTFIHNLSNGVTYDTINYLPVPESKNPIIVGEGFQVEMNDEDKDNIYIGMLSFPAGEKEYVLSIMMGEDKVSSIILPFNEVVDNYQVVFMYDHKRKIALSDYVTILEELDNRVITQSLYHNSRDEKYRTPFGAVPEGTEVTFTLMAKANDLEKANLVIEVEKITGNRDSVEYLNKQVYPLEKTRFSADGGSEIWQTTVNLNHKNVYGYYFEAIDGDKLAFYGNNPQIVPIPYNTIVGTGGVGKVYQPGERLQRYRLTVYNPAYTTPDWAKDAIFYYIFPDRFKNGKKANDPKVGVTKFYGDLDIEFHDNWLDKVSIPGDGCSDNEWNNDFFGGDLAGISKKLNYLKKLGVNTIYMTPIFEARSNHKYDTADYKTVDQHFGTNEEFIKLAADAKKKGIRIILDTSLNHSGSDSVYMDRYGKYPGIGAFKNEEFRKDSPYYEWYDFNGRAISPDQAYSCWDNPSLANLQEVESFKDFAYRDDESVMKFWLQKGASGWRMDVTPWVSDEFWREWRKEIKKDFPEALTVAETWFDASKYFLGDTFDSTMNYIFKHTMIEYGNGEDARKVVEVLEMMRENYPPEAFYSLMNLLSSHDQPRALFFFGYENDNQRLNKINEAKEKLILTVFFQMTYPGAPAVYYGDEVGVTGGYDPFNRGTYPWRENGGNPDRKILNEFQKLIKLRNDYEVLRRGSIETIYVDENVIVMLREYNGEYALVATNNSNQTKTVELDLSNYQLPSILKDPLNRNKKVPIDNGKLSLTIQPRYGRVLITK